VPFQKVVAAWMAEEAYRRLRAAPRDGVPAENSSGAPEAASESLTSGD